MIAMPLPCSEAEGVNEEAGVPTKTRRLGSAPSSSPQTSRSQETPEVSAARVSVPFRRLPRPRSPPRPERLPTISTGSGPVPLRALTSSHFGKSPTAWVTATSPFAPPSTAFSIAG